MEAYSYPSGAAIPLPIAQDLGTSHSMGIDPVTGQLYLFQIGFNRILAMNDNGSIGSVIVTSPGVAVSDLDYFNGDFLAVTFDHTVIFIDGVTGVRSTFLNTVQVTSMGFTAASSSSLTGIAIRTSSIPVGDLPEPLSLVIWAGIALISGTISRRRAVPICGFGWERR
jgi:hypothetical protein